MRFVDENLRPATDDEFRWADVVLLSGMHVQAPRSRHRRARPGHGKITVLGGPSVSASPEMYPDIDYLHVGEIGDATDTLLARARRRRRAAGRRRRCSRPTSASRWRTSRSPLRPARLTDYLIGSVQFSSGCPFRCEFCDIPALYGRRPRLKTPRADHRRARRDARQPGNPGTVYFVDDNFIGNRKAAADMLPHLVGGRSSTAIRSRSPARRRSTSPSRPTSWS